MSYNKLITDSSNLNDLEESKLSSSPSSSSTKKISRRLDSHSHSIKIESFSLTLESFYQLSQMHFSIEKEAEVRTNKKLELSHYKLDGSGILNENVIRTQKISAQVIEVNDEFVILECLVNASERIYQNRPIRKEILEGVIPFKLGQLVLINFKDIKGSNLIEYVIGDGIISPDDFNADEFFEGLDNSFIDYED